MPVYVPRLAAIAQRVVTVLRGDATLAARVGDRIYAQAPKDIQFPLLTVMGEEQPWGSTATSDGAEAVVTLTAYSVQAGILEVLEILERAVAVLTDDAIWTPIAAGAVATLVRIERPFVADLDGRLLTVQEARVQVRWGQ